MVTSEHYGDLKNWVIKNINSCENTKQLHTAYKLSKLLEKRLLNDEKVCSKILIEISREVSSQYEARLGEIMDTRLKNIINE